MCEKAKTYYRLNGKPVAPMSEKDPFAEERADAKKTAADRVAYMLNGKPVKRADGKIAYMS